jgi:hypothetical protein
MEISKERRERWERVTKDSPFNQWLNPLVRNADGSLNIESLYLIARAFGVYDRYDDLNAGQVRMNIGNRLRPLVTKEIIDRISGVKATPEAFSPFAKATCKDDIGELDVRPISGEGKLSEDTYEAEGDTYLMAEAQRVTCVECGHTMPIAASSDDVD